MPDDLASAWPHGAGEMAGRIRTFDWSDTPLGPIERWPQSLRTTVDLVLASGHAMLLAWGPARTVIYNDAYAPMLGDRHPGALALPFRKAWPDIWEEIEPLVERVFAGGTVRFEDMPLVTTRRSHPENAWWNFSCSPVRNEAGAVAGLLNVTVDAVPKSRAEAYRRSEQALRSSEGLRRVALAGGRMGTWRWDLSSRLIRGDTQFLALWGFPPSDEMRPLADFAERMSPEGATQIQAIVTKAVGENEEFDGPLEIVAGPTAGRWVRWRGRADADDPSILFGVTFDITDQRRAEQALRESDARHRLLIGSWAQAVWETDAEGVIVADSPSWRAYTGQTLDEWLGYGWLDAVYPDDRASAERQWREAIAVRSLVNAEFRLRTPGGDWRWTNVRAAPVLDADGRILKWAGMNIDIDARKRADAALSESEERQGFLLKLADVLRPVGNAQETKLLAATMLGRHLGANRVAYAENVGDEEFEVGRNYTDGTPEIVGRFPYAPYGSDLLADLQAGSLRIQPDIANDSRLSDSERKELADAMVGASLNVPLVKQGRLVAFLGVNYTAAHEFGAAEIELVQEVAERTWAAVERARVEAALREREADLARVQRIGAVGGLDIDVENGLRSKRSPEYLRLHGLSAEQEEETHDQWFRRVHPDDRQSAERTLLAALNGDGATYESEYRIVRPSDAAVRWIHARADIERDADGKPLRLVGAHIDVTEQKRTQEALAASEERLRAFGEASTDVLWIRDAETLAWTYLTPAFETIYGMGRDEALQGDNFRTWIDLVLPEDRQHAVDMIERVRGGESLAFEYRIRRPSDGDVRWLRDTDFPIQDAEGRVTAIGGVGHDATEEKEAEEALRESEAQLHVMVAELQHRTRNLIGVVGSIARQTMAHTGPTEAFQHEFVDRLEALSRVQGLLSRAGEDRITIRQLVEMELKALGAATFGDRVTVEGPDVPLRKSTIQTLALAIHELATNARKYGALSNDRGELAVRWATSRAEHEERRLFFEWTERGLDIRFEGGIAVTQGGGYGRQLIEKSLPYSLKAKTTYHLEQDGLRCTIDLPLGRSRPRSPPS